MKRLTTYISHVKDLHSLNEYLNEKLVVNKNYKYTYVPTSFDELKEIIEQRYEEQGPGTKQKPINFNDIDVNNIDSFYDGAIGLFERTDFEYIDISKWDVSNIKNMRNMFYRCIKLISIGDLSKWKVSKVEDMSYTFCDCWNLISVGDLSEWDVSNVKYINSMFYECFKLKSIGDLSEWDVSNVEHTAFMFEGCKKLKSVGDLSKWNVSKVEYMQGMFNSCKKLKSVGDISRWKVFKVQIMINMFKGSAITNIPKWYYE